MAEAILSNVAAEIISNVAKILASPIGLLWGLKDELHKLETTVSTIQAVLRDAEDKSMDEPVKIWLGMLSEAMYDADDLLDAFSTDASRQQVMDKAARKLSVFCSSFDLKRARKVKALRERLDEIAANRKFHLEKSPVVTVSEAKDNDQTHSFPPQVVVGREADKEKIIKLLVSSSDYEEKVSVVSIVGIGGLGKTTLAQLVYNDDMVQKHFELKIWVWVSDNFDVKLLVKKVLESATGETPNVTEMDPLKSRLHEQISGRKFLLVLDDVWNKRGSETEWSSKWLKLKDLLAAGARGSKIVLTTRLPEVAEMSRPICIHKLEDLSEDEAWSLFKQMACKQGQVLNPSYEAIGREIMAKCCGVPLAIRAIGGMLFLKGSESEWELFKNKELSKIAAYGENILPVLKLSYNHLPSHYKLCFAYCSLYPKGFKIPVVELIRHWKAHGYLKSTDSDECLQDLFWLSFFQDAEKYYFGIMKYCKMHDLMHDLAVSVAGDNFSTSLSKVTGVRHISFQVDPDSASQDFSSLLETKKIRTVLPLANDKSFNIKEEELDALFRNLGCLRVLNLSCLKLNKLPSSIGKLKHLRHLDLTSNFNIKKLPDSIINLHNLQVLILSGCSSLEQLPNNITKLVNLTDLVNDGCYKLTHMPRGIGKMTQLENLSSFPIAKDESISCNHHGGLDELHALNNLGGSLNIKNLTYLKNSAFEFKEANLNEKKHLQDLTLCWNQGPDYDISNGEMGLEALHPHQNLKGLTIVRYGGVRPPSWLPSLTNLVFIEFRDCVSIGWLPAFDHLPFLKKLNVAGLSNLEHIDLALNFENKGSLPFFPSLLELKLHDCPNLKGFVRCKTDDVGTKPSPISMEELPCFPCLSGLTISQCSNLSCMPLFPELKILRLWEDGIKSVMEVMKRATSSASEATSSPLSTLSQLEHLLIWKMEDCEVDELLPYLHSLQHLSFFSCPCKSVSSDEKDEGKQWQKLKALRSISFESMQNLVSLPNGLQYVGTLQRLDIVRCFSLTSIPEWMANLNALQDLNIYYCPQLPESCKNNTGADWPKISHIPNINIVDSIHDMLPIISEAFAEHARRNLRT